MRDWDPSTSAFLNALLREWTQWRVQGQPPEQRIVIDLPATGDRIEVPLAGELGVGRWPLGRPMHVARSGERSPPGATELAARMTAEPSLCAALGAGELDTAARRRFVARVADSQAKLDASLELRRDELDAIFTGALTFIQAEQALLLGHSMHPVPRAYDSSLAIDVTPYLPQHSSRIALEWFALRKDRLHLRCTPHTRPEHALPELEPELSHHASADVEIVPLHPLQSLALDDVLRRMERRGELQRLGRGRPCWAPTSSTRTLYRPGARAMLKVSLPLRLTNSMRTLEVAELERGLTLSRLLDETELAALERDSPGFTILREPSYYGLLDAEGSPLAASFVALRDNPFVAGAHAEVLATLLQDDPRDGCSRLAKRLIAAARAAGSSALETAEAWFSRFLARACRPIFRAQADYGLLLSAHQQNLVLGLRGIEIEHVWFRDAQGTAYSPLARERFGERVPSLAHATFEPPHDTRLFAYSFVVNTIFNVVASLAMVPGVRQAQLLEQLRTELETLRARPLRDPSVLDYLLGSPTIWAKGNLACSLRDVNEATMATPEALHHAMPNPLWSAGARVVTRGIEHPRRPHVPAGLLHRRACPAIGRVFELRRFDLDLHLDAFVAWMNDPVVARFWEQAWPRPQLREYVQSRLDDPHTVPMIGSFDDEPFAYFESYWAKEDRLGAYYDAHDYDRGFHMAVGDPRFRFRGLGRHWFLAMAHFLFADEPRTQRLVGEPRVDQVRVRSWASTTPWKIEGPLEFPHKRAVLMTLDRKDFFAGAGGAS